MTALAQQVVTPVIRDLDNVTETFVNGPISLNVIGPIATMIFTTVRPDAPQAFKGQVKDYSAVVSIRAAMPLETLVQLREMLNKSVLPQAMPMGSLLQQ